MASPNEKKHEGAYETRFRKLFESAKLILHRGQANRSMESIGIEVF